MSSYLPRPSRHCPADKQHKRSIAFQFDTQWLAKEHYWILSVGEFFFPQHMHLMLLDGPIWFAIANLTKRKRKNNRAKTDKGLSEITVQHNRLAPGLISAQRKSQQSSQWDVDLLYQFSWINHFNSIKARSNQWLVLLSNTPCFCYKTRHGHEKAALIIISEVNACSDGLGRKECIVSQEGFIKTRAGARPLYNSSLNIRFKKSPGIQQNLTPDKGMSLFAK